MSEAVVIEFVSPASVSSHQNVSIRPSKIIYMSIGCTWWYNSYQESPKTRVYKFVLKYPSDLLQYKFFHLTYIL